jgi:WD40 repeat protein
MAFTLDGNTLASANGDGTIQLWDVKSGIPIGTPLRGHSGPLNPITRLAWSSTGQLASADSSGLIILWNINVIMPASHLLSENLTRTVPTTLPCRNFISGSRFIQLSSTAISAGGKRVALGDTYGDIILWDAANMEDIGPLCVPAGSTTPQEVNDGLLDVGPMAFSPDGRMLAAVVGPIFASSAIIVWDIMTRNIIANVPTPNDVNSLAFSPNGHILAGGGSKGIILWNTVTRQVFRQLTTYTFSHSASYFPTGDLAFSPDGQFLASIASDSPFREAQFLLLWNVATWEPVGQPISISGESLVNFSFSPDRHTLALVSGRSSDHTISTITLWDIVTGKPIHQSPIGDRGTTYTRMVFSPDGKQLVLIGSLIGSNGKVGGIITLLDSVTLQPRFNPVHPADGYVAASMTFTSDEQQLAILVLHSPLLYDPVFPPRLLIWDINPDTWLTLACSIANCNFTADEWSKFGDGGPYQKVCRDLPVDKTEINEVLVQAQLAANKGDKQAAFADYAQATQWAIETSNPDLNNVICLSGGFDQFAKEVLPSCERAIALGPDNGRYHNSRGLARALMEDRQGAIEDFQLFVTWLMENYPSGSSSKYRDERNAWITALEAGRNPFDTKMLQALRQECLDSSFCYTTFSSPYHPND